MLNVTQERQAGVCLCYPIYSECMTFCWGSRRNKITKTCIICDVEPHGRRENSKNERENLCVLQTAEKLKLLMPRRQAAGGRGHGKMGNGESEGQARSNSFVSVSWHFITKVYTTLLLMLQLLLLLLFLPVYFVGSCFCHFISFFVRRHLTELLQDANTLKVVVMSKNQL